MSLSAKNMHPSMKYIMQNKFELKLTLTELFDYTPVPSCATHNFLCIDRPELLENAAQVLKNMGLIIS